MAYLVRMIHLIRLAYLCLLGVLLFLFQLQAAFAGLKVAVIGAGLSGLTTAYRLQASAFFQEAGHEVDVYEARARVGGRIFTVNLNGSPEELGGQNLYDGGEALNIIHLAEELGLGVQDTSIPTHAYYYDNAQRRLYDVNRDLVSEFPSLTLARKEGLRKIEAESKNMAEVLNRYFGTHLLLRDLFSARMKTYESSEVETLSTSYAHGSFLWMVENAQNSTEQEKKGESSIFKNGSIQGGNARLTEALAQRLGKRVHLSMPLKAIRQEQGQLELSFHSGQAIKADLIVITVPAAVLKKIQFDEGVVPEERLKNLTSVPMGAIAKVVVPIEKNKDTFGSLQTQRFLSWFNPSGQVMTLYYSGKAVSEVGSPGFVSQLHTDLEDVVKAFPKLGGLTLGNKSTAETLLVPKEEQFRPYSSTLVMNWAREPYSMGGYSYYTPQQYPLFQSRSKVLGEEVIDLFQPISNQVFFAGEHTALENPATMEGAVESGERTSRMVIRALESLKDVVIFTEAQQKFFVNHRKHYTYYTHLTTEQMSPKDIQDRFGLGSDENGKYLKDLEQVGLVQVKKDHSVVIPGQGKIHQWRSTDPLGRVQYYPVIHELLKEVEKNDRKKSPSPEVFAYLNGFILSSAEIAAYKQDLEKLHKTYSDLSVRNRSKLATGGVKKYGTTTLFGSRHDEKIFPEVDNDL